jgi:uncharacterized protein YjbJ (UPF0337 family)
VETIQRQSSEKWGKLTNDDLDVINGRRKLLVGKIQERYGMAKEIAEQQVDEFAKSLGEADRRARAGKT